MTIKLATLSLILITLFASCKKKQEPQPTPQLPEPTLTAFSLSTRYVGDANFMIPMPNSNSKGEFSYTSDNPAVATVSGDSILIKSAGTANITATQKATAAYTGGAIRTTFNVLPSIFIAGYSYTTSGDIALYWRNGSPVSLNGYGSANDIVVHNGDIYVAGTMSTNQSYAYPGYWKNGLQTIFPKTGGALGIAVLGNDVYVAGYTFTTYNASTYKVATLWKNGTEIPLQNPLPCCGEISSSVATGIAIYNNEIYICGTANDQSHHFSSAMIWKADGTGTALSKPSQTRLTDTSSQAFSITFQGGDIYLSGLTSIEFGNSYLTYWKNGTAMPFNLPAVINSRANAIAIGGADVNIAGIDAIGGTNNAAYWKNGVKTLLLASAEANDIAVQGSDTYVVGSTFPVANSITASPVYWLNGTINSLQAPNNTRAMAVTIVTH